MICLAIYVLKGHTIVFDSYNKALENQAFIPAGNYTSYIGKNYYLPYTTTEKLSYIVISKEAKELLYNALSFTNDKLITKEMSGNLLFMHNSFANDDDKYPIAYYPDENKTSLTIDLDGPIYVSTKNGFNRDGIRKIQEVDNEILKNLDLSKGYEYQDLSNMKKGDVQKPINR